MIPGRQQFNSQLISVLAAKLLGPIANPLPFWVDRGRAQAGNGIKLFCGSTSQRLLQQRLAGIHRKEYRLRNHPQLCWLGSRNRQARGAAYQGEMPHHLARANALQGERVLPFIAGQQAQETCGHNRQTRR